MSDGDNGPILTPKKKEVIEEEYEGSRQAKYDHKEDIQAKSKGACYDLQYLFNHDSSEELDLRKAFGEGYSHSDSDPIPWVRHNNPFGWIPDRHTDADGNPLDPDPDVNPNSKHELRRQYESFEGQNKASPETQEALIDTVAFLCRAAEAGELKVIDVLERGFERYHENRAERQPNESEKVVKVTQRQHGPTYTNARKQKAKGGRLTPIERKVLQSELDEK